jgi:hypothetical protein
MKKYDNFLQFWNAFKTGKIVVKSKDGRIGLYKNYRYADEYFQPILKEMWDKQNQQ